MAQNLASIHGFYRAWFTIVDPLTLVPTSLLCVIAPGLLMEGFIPLSMSAPNPDHAFLFHQIAALYAFVAIVMAFVLRASSDVRVWRIVEAGVLLIDATIVASTFVSLGHQGRLDVGQWRLLDWANLVYTGGVGLMRALFLAGYGVGTTRQTKPGRRRE